MQLCKKTHTEWDSLLSINKSAQPDGTSTYPQAGTFYTERRVNSIGGQSTRTHNSAYQEGVDGRWQTSDWVGLRALLGGGGGIGTSRLARSSHHQRSGGAGGRGAGYYAGREEGRVVGRGEARAGEDDGGVGVGASSGVAGGNPAVG